jgi:hypothetical protein
MANQGYASLWNKYRPAILQLMVAADEGPQEYKFFKHEFKAINPKEKGYAFNLEAFQGKAVNSIKASTLAKDLLSVLASSPKASELMEGNAYEFNLDKQFVLHITKRENEAEVTEGQGSDKAATEGNN